MLPLSARDVDRIKMQTKHQIEMDKKDAAIELLSKELEESVIECNRLEELLCGHGLMQPART